MIDLLPPDPEDMELLHTRTYQVRAYRKSATTMMLRGAVRDVKPAGLYVPDDPEPLVVHHMVLELDIEFPSTEISRAEVVFEERPHLQCTDIVPHYEKLVGLSISRGFTHKVRELFGGPRGCSHVTMLLQAMAPVVNQSRFSLMMITAMSQPLEERKPPTPERRAAIFATNVNTCHVWEENTEHTKKHTSGEELDGELPLWIEKRFTELGRDPHEWRNRMT